MNAAASRTLWIVLLVVFAFLILWPRVAHLSADPPVSLSQAFQNVGVFLYDEGWWTANARHKVLFGEWTFGSYNLMYVSPVFNDLAWAAFSLFGVSLKAARLPSLILGLLGLLLFFFLARRGLGPQWGTAATFITGLSYPLTIYHRVALLEPAALFFALLAGFLWFQKAAFWSLLAGASVALALLTKLSLVYLVPVFVLLGALGWTKGGRKKCILFLAGLSLSSVVWLFAFFLPHRGDVLAAYRQYDRGRWIPGAVGYLSFGLNAVKLLFQSLITGAVYRHEVLSQMPLLFLVSWFGALVLLRRPGAISGPSAFFLLWAGIGGFFLALSSYQPMRYFCPLIPAMGYLTTAWARSAWPSGKPSGGKAGASFWLHLLGWAGLSIVLSQVLYAVLLPVVRNYSAQLGLPENDLFRPQTFSLSAMLWRIVKSRSLSLLFSLNRQQTWMALQTLLAVVSLASGTALAALAFVFFGPTLRAAKHFLMRPALVVIVLTLGLGFDLCQTWTWALHPKYTIRDFSRYLGEALPPGTVVSPSGAYALENRLRYDNSELWTGKVVKYDPPVNAVVLLDSHPLLGKGKLQDILREHEDAFLLKRTAVLDGQYHLAVFKLERGTP
jgi:4-amino-4-deoxy-L-arabinose transferase-like glycosyltransferase